MTYAVRYYGVEYIDAVDEEDAIEKVTDILPTGCEITEISCENFDANDERV